MLLNFVFLRNSQLLGKHMNLATLPARHILVLAQSSQICQQFLVLNKRILPPSSSSPGVITLSPGQRTANDGEQFENCSFRALVCNDPRAACNSKDAAKTVYDSFITMRLSQSLSKHQP
jgi:hypothetical protein